MPIFTLFITLESWFTNLEQTTLNRCQPLPATPKRLLNRKQQHIVYYSSCNQSIYMFPHTSSQPITSRVHQRLFYLLTNQIAHQSF